MSDRLKIDSGTRIPQVFARQRAAFQAAPYPSAAERKAKLRMNEYPIARMFHDSRAQRIYGGADEIMKVLIARTL